MENQEMKTGYIIQFDYNNRWTNNGKLEHGFICKSAESAESIKKEAFSANAGRNIRIVKFEYEDQKIGSTMYNIEVIKELSYK